ncbi:hypothetical protein [Methanococcoides burtonii]|uniref:Uncharacterized protein n=1 Tax=Methanococcoides burtonii (strain DSM 6242 / NBRC 107633 / OCM 468 / ACE-M) TaxID=259564 RepID=Q12YF7_METBU|nr:hypothetical protein [Methanococcoides burtonii]ABE51519.1 Hypothetical protein Mbur_0542 [Methanococcoides burtonii DSM 6242]
MDTGEEIAKERNFWFACYTFHPETTIYLPEGFEPELPEEKSTSLGIVPPVAAILFALAASKKKTDKEIKLIEQRKYINE